MRTPLDDDLDTAKNAVQDALAREKILAVCFVLLCILAFVGLCMAASLYYDFFFGVGSVV
jgi:hypothetical protein